MGYSCTGAF
jgi:site-specific recombinase XerD